MGPWPYPWAHLSHRGALGVSMPALHLRGTRKRAAPILAGDDARTGPDSVGGGSALRAREGDLDPAVLLAAGFRGVVGDGVLLAVATDLVGDVGIGQLLIEDVLYSVGPLPGQDVAVGGGAEVVREAEDADLRRVLRLDLLGDRGDPGLRLAAEFRAVLAEEDLGLEGELDVGVGVFATFVAALVFDDLLDVEDLGVGEGGAVRDLEVRVVRIDLYGCCGSRLGPRRHAGAVGGMCRHRTEQVSCDHDGGCRQSQGETRCSHR